MEQEMFIVTDVEKKIIFFNELGIEEDIMTYEDAVELKSYLDDGVRTVHIAKLILVD